MTKFAHLHVHTEYSLLDGLSNIPDLIKCVKQNGMDSVAITDHGALYGAVEFYKEAKKEGVKPIVGIEAYMSAGKMQEKSEKGRTRNFHLILLAKDNQGYKNLLQLTSLAHLEGYYYRPRFDKETLAKYAQGLICTSACPLGEVGQALIQDDYKLAKSTAKWFLDVFGKNYYLEIQKHNFNRWLDETKNEQIRQSVITAANNSKKVNDGIIKISRELGIPLVATNDSHYIKKEDAKAQDALVCIATGKTVSDVNRLRYIDTPDFYIKTPEEMAKDFSDYPEAVENTVKIAGKCSLEITLGKWFFPKFELPQDKTPNKCLKEQARKLLGVKLPSCGKEEKDRLEHELKIICDKGYAPYFLIMADIVAWANENGIITNTRGSAAGSLVSFVLGITTVNPLLYYLPFERFLNPFRPSPPDIDLDVADNKREQLISYICQKYGSKRVAQVCTFGRMLARGSVRDVARILGYPYSVGDRISKLIPMGSQGFPMTIAKALETTPELRDYYGSDPDAEIIVDLAREIEGNARHISVHAAGVVVAPTQITDFTPIQKEPSGDKIITQYEMHACEDVGLIKFDILGIRNLSILGAAIDIVGQLHGVRINLGNIPLDDKKTFDMLARGETMGVFQLGGSGMTKYIKDLKPTRVEDLMAMVALYRPGPISQIPEYISRKHNPKLVKYLDPRMKKFLGPSYGLIVYQDDLLFCALDLAGYSWEEADKFRKAVGKKIPEEMAAQKQKFTRGIIKNGQSAAFAETLWKLFEPFQSYGFNKAHAASYGIVAYQTAYMKANYPVEYMAALLTAEEGDAEKVSAAVNECRRMKIEILPPDINLSAAGFKIEGKGIRFGLGAIKNVGVASIEAILTVRKDRNFTSFADFLSRIDGRKVNKKVLESLIKAGALSAFGNRATLLSVMDDVRNKAGKANGLKGQQGLFGKEESLERSFSFTQVEELTETEIETLERQLLGLSISAKPLAEILGHLEGRATHKIFDISTETPYEEAVKVAGVVREVRTIVTKTGSEMAFVKIEDTTGTIESVVFPRVFKESRDFWVENKPLLVSGKVDFRGETPSLLVEKVVTEKEVCLKILEKISTEQLKHLKKLLLANPGEEAVSLLFAGTQRTVKLPQKIKWTPTLAKEIADVLK